MNSSFRIIVWTWLGHACNIVNNDANDASRVGLMRIILWHAKSCHLNKVYFGIASSGGSFVLIIAISLLLIVLLS